MRYVVAMAVMLMWPEPGVRAQNSTAATSAVSQYLGTWVINMTEPKGAVETVRISDQRGRIAGTLQAQKFPPIAFTDAAKMGKSLVLAATRFENGQPIQAIVILTLEGETMHMIQELEGSTITKRGVGARQ